MTADRTVTHLEGTNFHKSLAFSWAVVTWAILLALGLIGAPPLAQAQLSESPITSGFWSFANRKSETTEDVRAACRNYIEIRFADGHYIGLRIYKTESGVAVREVGEVGRCTFNRETQVEHCDKRLIKPDGSIMLGTTESRYSISDGKTLKMTVTPPRMRGSSDGLDFCHCGRRGARDRAYRTISPSSDTQITGASTDKISHPTNMHSPKLFRHHRGR